MKRKYKLIFVFVTLVIIVLSIFVVAVQYEVIDVFKEEEEEKMPLSVKIFADAPEGVVPHTIHFSSIVLNYEGDVKYHWDLGNGNTSDGKNPTATYGKNDTYRCNLTVTDDSGEKASNSMVILAIGNHKPTVSIEFDTNKPRRPYNFLLEYILPKIIHIENYGSNDYRALREKGLLDTLFKGMDSFLTVEASASDEDGDEIVSYNWTLRPPSYATRIGKNTVDPEYHYSGRKIDIPAIDIYPAFGYSLKVTVTDSAGQKRSENFEFEVLKSNRRNTFEEKKRMLNYYKDQWINKWHSNEIMRPIILGLAIIVFKFIKELPLTQLLLILGIKLILQTEPKEYTGYENLMGPLKELTDNRQWAYNFVNKSSLWLQENHPDTAKNVSKFFGAEDIEAFREELGFENKRPIISNPSPRDNSALVNLTTSKVWVSVNDPEGDKFNVCIYGDYINTTANHYVNYTNVTNSSFSAPLITPLPPSGQNETYINWHVKVVDPKYSDEVVKEDFRFSTAYE